MIKNAFKGFLSRFFGDRWLDWEEYENKVAEIENLMFLTKTCQSAIRNYWQKEGRR